MSYPVIERREDDGSGTPGRMLSVVFPAILFLLGLALMFTPLFTSALGSLPMHLYSHGSAMVGTVQQVAGAAGTALFVTVLTAQSATLAAAGSGVVDATAGGIHAAFLVGAVISLAAIPAAFFVKAAPSPVSYTHLTLPTNREV